MITYLFPARAGVIPVLLRCSYAYASIPRTRGGDPLLGLLIYSHTLYSPHARG